jgi:hypothetical protein
MAKIAARVNRDNDKTEEYDKFRKRTIDKNKTNQSY